MRIAVVMDPIDRIKPWKDTSFAFLLSAQARGWECWYIEPEWLFFADGAPRAEAAPVHVVDRDRDFHTLGERSARALTDFDIILQRQDPPIDLDYHYITGLLSLAEQAGVVVANRPDAVRAANEKLLAQHFPDFCPPTLVSRSIAQLRAFAAEQGEIVVKPLDAMGGSSVFKVHEDDVNTQVILEVMTKDQTELVMAQRYLPEIRTGDRRVLLIDGEPVDHALLRIPGQKSFRANLAAGGRGEVVPLRERDREIAAAVGPWLAERGHWFVGLDVIGDWLTEVNVTSPTCAREISAATGQDVTGQLLDHLATRVPT
ncbi:glutathione synthase [Guyparkeria hydrothermalis]|uniref:glutathione synthase n=1 Tax=Guyparkeria hydrothermalis TaxID=923 RepID=UPI002020FF68|nr:glutathione synthase [Guyparkeria hydrothermalis]MCL7745120.1 glutathione synthase [Guyparkeria hydrothermalis]